MPTTQIQVATLEEIVELELRDQASQDQILSLMANTSAWRTVLLGMKRKTEAQFTICRSRLFNAWHDYSTAKNNPAVTDEELNALWDKTQDVIRKEKDWQQKANFFLSKIEHRLQQIKTQSL